MSLGWLFFESRGGLLRGVSGGRTGIVCLIILLLCGGAARGQENAAVRLEVDLRDAAKRVYHSKMEFPVKPGPLTLVYPKWIPGEHSPSEAIVDATGLHFRGGGEEIAWRRDDVDLYAFRCTIPAGVTTLEVTLDYLLPAESGTAGVPSSSPRWGVRPGNLVVLY